MRVLVCNRSDAASVNIRDRLLEGGDWELTGARFRRAVVWGQSEAILIEVEGPTVTDEALAADLEATGLPLRDAWFLSRHRAASGQPSLTVHPIGNHAPVAQLGGRPSALSPVAARDMGALLRRLQVRSLKEGLPHAVTYEATHHGPSMRIPSLFVEIGSDEAWYGDRLSGQVVAAAITDVLAGEGRCTGPVLVGVGGGHYMPRATAVAQAGEADFGHLIPTHDVAAGSQATLERAVQATPECGGVHLDRKALSGAQRQEVLQWCSSAGAPVWRRP
ncbi:MAG: D-aminoacyl-tRNA deacylase [Thermoplasmatota archaeon]